MKPEEPFFQTILDAKIEYLIFEYCTLKSRKYSEFLKYLKLTRVKTSTYVHHTNANNKRIYMDVVLGLFAITKFIFKPFYSLGLKILSTPFQDKLG